MPAVAVSTPPPAPVSPPAPPKPFDPADLVGNPSAWPRTVHLKQAVVFPALYNAQVVGSVTAPPGAVVSLVNIQGDQLILDYNGGRQRLPWKQTDLAEEVAKSNLAAPQVPATDAPPAASAPTAAAPPLSAAPAGN